MNKPHIDNIKAHVVREEDIESLNEIFRSTSFSFELLNPEAKLYSAREMITVNQLLSRYATTTMQGNKVGHALALKNNQKAGVVKPVEMRYDNKNGIYWKGINGIVSIDLLMGINPVFIIYHKTSRMMAFLDFKNPYMLPKYWKQGGKGNENRLQNTKLPHSFKNLNGYSLDYEFTDILFILEGYFT